MPLESSSVTIAAGVSSAAVELRVNDDNVTEGTESFSLGLSTSVGSAILAVTTPATVNITDDDSATLRVMDAPLSFAEDVGAATVTLELTGPLSGALDVMVSSSDGTATAGSDYTALSQTVSIAAGDTSATVSLDITDDMVTEGEETLSLSLFSRRHAPGEFLGRQSCCGDHQCQRRGDAVPVHALVGV